MLQCYSTVSHFNWEVSEAEKHRQILTDNCKNNAEHFFKTYFNSHIHWKGLGNGKQSHGKL
jgi:hypothetical protein